MSSVQDQLHHRIHPQNITLWQHVSSSYVRRESSDIPLSGCSTSGSPNADWSSHPDTLSSNAPHSYTTSHYALPSDISSYTIPEPDISSSKAPQPHTASWTISQACTTTYTTSQPIIPITTTTTQKYNLRSQAVTSNGLDTASYRMEDSNPINDVISNMHNKLKRGEQGGRTEQANTVTELRNIFESLGSPDGKLGNEGDERLKPLSSNLATTMPQEAHRRSRHPKKAGCLGEGYNLPQCSEDHTSRSTRRGTQPYPLQIRTKDPYLSSSRTKDPHSSSSRSRHPSPPPYRGRGPLPSSFRTGDPSLSLKSSNPSPSLKSRDPSPSHKSRDPSPSLLKSRDPSPSHHKSRDPSPSCRGTNNIYFGECGLSSHQRRGGEGVAPHTVTQQPTIKAPLITTATTTLRATTPGRLNKDVNLRPKKEKEEEEELKAIRELTKVEFCRLFGLSEELLAELLTSHDGLRRARKRCEELEEEMHELTNILDFYRQKNIRQEKEMKQLRNENKHLQEELDERNTVIQEEISAKKIKDNLLVEIVMLEQDNYKFQKELELSEKDRRRQEEEGARLKKENAKNHRKIYRLEENDRKNQEELERLREHSAKLEKKIAQLEEEPNQLHGMTPLQERASQQEQTTALQQENMRLRKERTMQEEEITHLRKNNVELREETERVRGNVVRLEERGTSLMQVCNRLQEKERQMNISEKNKQQEQVEQVNQMKSRLEVELRVMQDKEARRERETARLKEENAPLQKEVLQERENVVKLEERVTLLIGPNNRLLEKQKQSEKDKQEAEQEKRMKNKLEMELGVMKDNEDRWQRETARLKKENADQQETIALLKEENNRRLEMLQLKQDLASEQEIIPQCREEKDRSEEALTQLKENKAKQEEVILRLQKENDRYRKKVTQLRQERDSKQQQVMDLGEEKARFEETVNNLRRTEIRLQKEMKKLAEEVNLYQEQALQFKKQEESALMVADILQQENAELKSKMEGFSAHSSQSQPQKSSAEEQVVVENEVVVVGGLPNLGNTCYMNSVVQCLYHLPALRNCLATCLREHAHNPQQAVNQSSESQGRVAVALAKMFRAMEQGRGTYQAMENLKGVLGSMDEMFAGHEQQEAHDLLCSLLFWLHCDLSKDTPSASPSEQDSPISSLFHGLLNSTVMCYRQDLINTSTTETFTNLSLTVGRYECTLEELLAQHFRKQEIEWDCQHCCRSHQCPHRTSVLCCPRVLVIHFNRYGLRSRSSHKARVMYPHTGLTLQPHMAQDSPRSPQYQLVGVVCHRGSRMAGHYISYCRGATERCWRLCNDDFVMDVTLQEVLNQEGAHLLFYLLQEH